MILEKGVKAPNVILGAGTSLPHQSRAACQQLGCVVSWYF